MNFAPDRILAEGGPVLFANLALAALLYARCCGLLLQLWQVRRRLAAFGAPEPRHVPVLRRWQEELQELFRRQRLLIGAMIAAAPLLGLLGTVAGMVRTFESLAAHGARSVEGLASGISEALLNTEAGLVVAIPGVLVLYGAHRLMQKGLQDLVRLELRAKEGC